MLQHKLPHPLMSFPYTIDHPLIDRTNTQSDPLIGYNKQNAKYAKYNFDYHQDQHIPNNTSLHL